MAEEKSNQMEFDRELCAVAVAGGIIGGLLLSVLNAEAASLPANLKNVFVGGIAGLLGIGFLTISKKDGIRLLGLGILCGYSGSQVILSLSQRLVETKVKNTAAYARETTLKLPGLPSGKQADNIRMAATQASDALDGLPGIDRRNVRLVVEQDLLAALRGLESAQQTNPGQVIDAYAAIASKAAKGGSYPVWGYSSSSLKAMSENANLPKAVQMEAARVYGAVETPRGAQFDWYQFRGPKSP